MLSQLNDNDQKNKHYIFMYIRYLNGPVFSVSKYGWRFQLLFCTSRVPSAEKCNLKSVVRCTGFYRAGHMTGELMDVVFSKWVIPTMTHLGVNVGLSRLFIIWMSVCLVSPSWTLLGGVKLEVLLSQLASYYVCPIVPTLPLILCQILVQCCHCSVVFYSSF